MRAEKRISLLGVETIVAVLLFALIAFALFVTHTTRQQTIDDETKNLARLSLILTANINRVFFGADLIVTSLEERIEASGMRSQEHFLQVVTGREMHSLLQEKIVQSADIDELTFADAGGKIVNSSRVWPPPQLNVSDREHFIALRDQPGSGFFISPPAKNLVTGQQSILFSRRINSADGRFMGLIIATLSAGRFEKLIAAARHGGGATSALYRRDGVLLAQAASDTVPQKEAEVRHLAQELISRAEHGTGRAVNGDAHLLAARAVGGYPLMIVVTNSEAVVLAEWRRLAQLIFMFSFAAVFIVALLGIAFFRAAKMQAQIAEASEQLARVNAALTTSNHDLESFSYSVAHDLRAPLRRIDGFSAIVLQESRDKLGEQSANYLDRVRASVLQMGTLVDDLLELSRIARSEIRRRDFDLGDLARSIVAALAEANPGRNVDVLVGQGMRVVNGDPGLLRIALENLLGNAWKFSSRTDGARVDVGAEEGDGEITFFVRDNGAGFDMQYSAKLFKPFQRLHHVSEFEGTGIGLSIVHRIVSRHGGRIWAESEIGKGTVFRFTLGQAA